MRQEQAQPVSLVILAVFAASLGLSGCSSAEPSPDPDGTSLINVPGTNQVTDTLSVAKKRTWIVGSSMICLSSPGRVTVTGVTPRGDISITGFALRRNPGLEGGMQVGALDETLASAGISTGSRVIDTLCGQPRAGNSVELIVQVAAGEGTTRATALVVSYTTGGRTAMLTVPHAIVLCDVPDVNKVREC